MITHFGARVVHDLAGVSFVRLWAAAIANPSVGVPSPVPLIKPPNRYLESAKD
jgi:hypothetical protein